MDIPISPDADGREIAETFFHLTSQTLQTAYNGLDYNALRRAALMISKADLVHIYGSRPPL